MCNWGVKRLIIQYILSILICLPIHQNNIPWQDFTSEVKKKYSFNKNETITSDNNVQVKLYLYKPSDLMWNALSRTCELCLRSFLYLFKKQEAAYPRAFQHYKYISFVYKTLIEKSMTQLYTLLYMFIKQLLKEVEHDNLNYQNQGLSHLPKLKAEADYKDMMLN